MQTDKEMYYNALVESNKILYRKKRLLRYIDKKKITIDQYEKVLMALCKAKTEENLNAILANALNSIITIIKNKSLLFADNGKRKYGELMHKAKARLFIRQKFFG